MKDRVIRGRRKLNFPDCRALMVTYKSSSPDYLTLSIPVYPTITPVSTLNSFHVISTLPLLNIFSLPF